MFRRDMRITSPKIRKVNLNILVIQSMSRDKHATQCSRLMSMGNLGRNVIEFTKCCFVQPLSC